MPTERQFLAAERTLAAEVWGLGNERRLLALHGWLDNAGSFSLLAPRLTGCEVVALDLAGHGRSDFRSRDAAYNVWQDVGDVLDVVDALGWQRCTLLGHSRGAAISMLFAAAFPERVDNLVLLEGGMPLTGNVDDAPANLARAVRETRSLARKEGRVFERREVALAERAQGFSKVTLAAAEELARRSLRAVEGGFQWRADQRLKATSELKLTDAHARAFARQVLAPVLLVLATESPFSTRPLFREAADLFASIEIEHLPGGHHFHLEGAETAIAARIIEFLER